MRREDGAALDPSTRIAPGDRFEVRLAAPAPATLAAEAIALDILYEDDALIIVNKPAGMVVHPAPGHERGTLVNALLAHCGESLSGVGGVRRPGIVHRIDKDTSGLVVVAKNDAAHQGLAVQFAAHDLDRVYDAIAVGAPRPGVGVIDAPIARSRADRTKMAVLAPQEEDDDTPSSGRRAVTHYKVTEAFGRTRAKLKGDALASLLECRLETGRTHQIRAHLASIHHPIVGDPVYGRLRGVPGLKAGDAAADRALASLAAFRRQALHARVLGFAHPISDEPLWFETPAPADFAALLAALRAL